MVDWNLAVHNFEEALGTTQVDWGEAFEDIDVLGAVIRDVISVQPENRKRGHRYKLSAEEGEHLVRRLAGNDFSFTPFSDTLRALMDAKGQKVGSVASASGIPVSKLRSLLKSEREPSAEDMESVAETFDKRPDFFVEYRAVAFGSMVAQKLLDAPRFSATLFDKFKQSRIV